MAAMRRLTMTALAASTLLACAASGATRATAAVRVVDVPGVAGRSVQISAAGRLADGGAIVAGTVTPDRKGARARLVVMRLRHDGLVDRSFGDAGVVEAQLARGSGGSGSRATAVAVDPARGRSWIGASIGRANAGAVLALDGGGHRLKGFGSSAVVRLKGDASAPTALAFGGGRLAVAATTQPCAGCQVLVLDPASGARRALSPLAPVADGAPAGCPQARLDSLALPGSDRLVLGGSGGAACPTRIVVRDGALAPVSVWDAGGEPQRLVVAAAGTPLDLCVGIQNAGAVRLARVPAGTAGPAPVAIPGPTYAPVAGTLGGVVPLGDGACGALLLHDGKPASVLQASAGDAHPAITSLPAGLRAGAIYRCNQHVLVVGARRSNGVERASVAVTMITRR
jgi:hypothetical protein